MFWTEYMTAEIAKCSIWKEWAVSYCHEQQRSVIKDEEML
jgi:hypothetical protein